MQASRRLVLFRHAKSDRPVGVADHQRPLATRGQRDATAAGAWLRDNLDAIDLAVCSTATRARQTWELASQRLADEPQSRAEQRVYAATAEELLAVVRDIPAQVGTAVIVGHNPGLEDLLSMLGGNDDPLKTSGIAVLHGQGGWVDCGPGMALVAMATPRG